MRGTCALCHIEKELRLSHIIPKFVFAWFKLTSPGAIRMGASPNVRVQDGFRAYLLCNQCEQLLSNWESRFYKEIFLPIHETNGQQTTFPYQEWAMKFAVSVSWRVLIYYSKNDPLVHLTDQQSHDAIEAQEVWREFMLDERPHPDRFEQHILPVDLISSHSLPQLSRFINRYLLRSVDMGIPASSKRAFVYTKMCRLILFGIITESHPKYWLGTRLHVRKGMLGSKSYRLPGGVAEYISNQSNKAARALGKLSPKQSAKVRGLFNSKPDLIAQSEVFRAADQDFYLFGPATFDYEEPKAD